MVRLGFLLFFFSFACQVFADGASSLMKAGGAYAQKNYSLVQQILVAVNQSELSDSEKVIYFKLAGLSNFDLGNASAAEDAFVQIIKIEPSYTLSRDQYSRDAIAAFEKAKSGYAQVYYQQGVKDYEAGNYTAAKSSFEKTLSIDSKHPMAGDFLQLSNEKAGTKSGGSSKASPDSKSNQDSKSSSKKSKKSKDGMASISDLSPKYLKMTELSIGEFVYLDRDYTVSRIPKSLRDLLLIRSANDDKKNPSFKVNFNLAGDATIYVAIDSRMFDMPKWLKSWSRTGQQIEVDRGQGRSSRYFDVYSKKFTAGNVMIGPNSTPNSTDTNVSMYFVLIK